MKTWTWQLLKSPKRKQKHSDLISFLKNNLLPE